MKMFNCWIIGVTGLAQDQDCLKVICPRPNMGSSAGGMALRFSQ